MRTIRVTGKGQIRVRPDMTRITVTLTGLYKEYSETLRRSSADTEAFPPNSETAEPASRSARLI